MSVVVVSSAMEQYRDQSFFSERLVMQMLSLSYITVEGAEPSEEIAAAASAGFSAVGLRLAGPSGRPHISSILGRPECIKAIAGELRASGVALLDVEVLTLTERFDASQAEALIDASAELEALYLQVVCEDTDLGRATDRLAGLAEIAGERSIALALEFMCFRTVDNLNTARKVARNAGAELIVDALHHVRSGGTVEELGGVPANQIAFFQLCDAPMRPGADLVREARFDRLYPGEGELPLRSMLEVLPPTVWVSVEVPRITMIGRPPLDQALAAMEWTRKFLTV